MTSQAMSRVENDLKPKADCLDCPHRQDRLRSGRCIPGFSCVRVSSGRQIANFFNNNPDLADHYAGDEFWERRAIAARYLSWKRLMQMLDDPDEVVRRVLAYRLPVESLSYLIRDPDREVRITVADRLVGLLLGKGTRAVAPL
ncbi:MAG: 4Fe4S-binding leucine-rich repeat protein, partial [Candidatus Sedimenticola sp. 4PFRAG1]